MHDLQAILRPSNLLEKEHIRVAHVAKKTTVLGGGVNLILY